MLNPKPEKGSKRTQGVIKRGHLLPDVVIGGNAYLLLLRACQIASETSIYSFMDANQALDHLKKYRLQ